MSTPDTSATQQEAIAPVESSLEEKVIVAEQRFKDTQAAYTQKVSRQSKHWKQKKQNY